MTTTEERAARLAEIVGRVEEVREALPNDTAAVREERLGELTALHAEAAALHEEDPELLRTMCGQVSEDPAVWQAFQRAARALRSAEQSGGVREACDWPELEAVADDLLNDVADPTVPLDDRLDAYEGVFEAAWRLATNGGVSWRR